MNKEIRIMTWHVDHKDIPDEYWILPPAKKPNKK